ncbi:MAG: hypothetical protein VB047_09550 [Anaerotignum propionicum]|uniref:hypothetical protein n=1 Tax=Anaerotignum propionicum TaxID=28446 RepID=UPI002B21FCE3|nr:hypothetical protein [Anaerotignum propionicum]MEA5057785.1 hypothetical protein [Anaerotignum propionicum]
MSVKHRVDSVKDLKKRKTLEELSAENEQLKIDKVTLAGQVTDLQLALCDVYEMMETNANSGA